MRDVHEDSYKTDAKLPEPTCCPDCGATYAKGRWTWEKAPADAHAQRCPACLRIHDHFPAGHVLLKGKLSPERRSEVLSLVAARGERAKAEHPLQRIMSLEEKPGEIVVTTTETHLAGAIARAVHDAFHGTLDLRYNKDEHLVRAILKMRPG